MKKQFKHVNPKILLRKVYTEQGGVKEYNRSTKSRISKAQTVKV